MHVHLAALPEGNNGCYISPKMMRSPLFRFFAWRWKLDLHRPAIANSAYIGRLLTELDRSKKVKRAVLLGMDGVYDEAGSLDLTRTDFLVSNRYVFEVVKRYPDYFLAGVSINPKRRDALEELERCAAQGAALVKVLPNSQRFDPSERRYIPFYRALAQRRIPLLSHVGYEFSLMGQDQTAGDPKRLRVALDEGVCVIAAHACSYGLVFPEPYFKVFTQLARKYPNFYADTSALTLPNRVRTLFFLRKHPELHDCLIFGTDYPLPVFSYPALCRGYGRAPGASSSFDRQALVLKALGIRCRDLSSLTKMCQEAVKVPEQ
ncbi:MAG: amidohydrolase family protein [Candidatus Binatia bacterium]